MPSPFVADSIAAASLEVKIWPKDVTLIEPPVENILLTELANSKAAQGLLRLHGLHFNKETRHNVEFMTNTGRTPILKVDGDVIDEGSILKFLQFKAFSYIQDFPAELKLHALSYLSYIEDVIVPAELYSSWVEADNVKQTQCKYAYGYPTILGFILSRRKQSRVKHHLSALGWQHKTTSEVIGLMRHCCTVFEQKLKFGKFLLGDSPCEVDVVLSGHLAAMLNYKQQNPFLENAVRDFPILLEYCSWFRLDGAMS